MSTAAAGNRPAAAAPLPQAPRIRSALFGIASHPPAEAPRWTLWVITALFALLVLWAFLARLDIVAVAPGRLVPQTHVKIVQPAVAGIVREILVAEGDTVEAGQLLLRLDPTESTADRTAIAQELAIQHLQLRRIDAELDARSLEERRTDDPTLFAQTRAQYRSNRQAQNDAILQQRAARDRSIEELAATAEMVRKLELMLPSYQRSAQAYEKLESRKLVSLLQAEDARRAVIETEQNLAAERARKASLQAAVTEAEQQLAQLGSRNASALRGERVQVSSRISQLEQQHVKAGYQQGNLDLKAPQAGTVKELATTTLGAVVQPGTVLVSLVPKDEPLLAEVMIENQDIGFVQPGYTVRLKLATYPFQRYGMLDGVVKTVMADAQGQPAAQPHTEAEPNTDSGVASTMTFKATIELKEQSLAANGMHLPLAAGMQLSAEIIEGRRTVMEYLLSPVRRVVSEAGMER